MDSPFESQDFPAEDVAYIERRMTMLYFVQNNVLHRFPVAKRCSSVRKNEPLRDTIPHGVEQCVYCMRYWPGVES